MPARSNAVHEPARRCTAARIALWGVSGVTSVTAAPSGSGDPGDARQATVPERLATPNLGSARSEAEASIMASIEARLVTDTPTYLAASRFASSARPTPTIASWTRDESAVPAPVTAAADVSGTPR